MTKRYVCGILLALCVGAPAQTKLDLGNQSQNINFSQATSVIPFPTGSALPATCNVGQMFFLTGSGGGPNECLSANTWTPVQSGSATPATALVVQQTSATQLTIGPSCAIGNPCVFRIGSSVYSMMAPATVTVTGGTGIASIYIDVNGNLTVGLPSVSNLSITCSGCVAASGITQYPPGVIPLASWQATSGAWSATGTNNSMAPSAPPALIAGSNIMIAQTAGTVTISSSGSGSSGGSGSGSTSSGPTGIYYNPTDPTQFFRDHLTLATGFSNGADGWGYSNCGAGSGNQLVGFTQESIFSAPWGQVSGAGNVCFFFFPTTSNSVWGTGTFDYWSGLTPAQLWVSATYKTLDANGAHYVGLSSSAGGFADFIGCRQIGTGDWFAVIRAGGTDLATADTGVPQDTNVHRIEVDNGAGMINTIRCSVDGGPAALASGAVPAETFGWYYIFGATPIGSASTTFAPFEYTIFLQGLPRQ